MKKLLVIRFSALGDVAMVLPVIKALAAAYPEWDITMLSKKQWGSLFLDLPDNVHFFGADLKGKHSGLAGLNRLLHDLKYWEFDAVADLHAVIRTLYLRHRCLWRGKRVAHLHKDRYQKWLLVRHFYQYKHPLQSTVSRYRTVLEELGFEFNIPFPHGISNVRELYGNCTGIVRESYGNSTGQTRVASGIGIAPFAAHKGKIYPLDKMEEVVKQLSERLHAKAEKEGTECEKIYLFGAGPKEKEILQSWADRYPHVECLVGKYTMDEEIRFMSTLRLMITMDSANMHLASLVGTRVLSIWGATHPWAGFLGYGQSENDCIQLSIPCRPCSIYGNRRCKFGDYRCLDIEPRNIVERVLGALAVEA
ncbi:MAG: glycosyltransferase family 9 protein [Paludibacteraceae bacterium]|nr:glycosyltransferase family 9 protein [Paludibacteraceae bacterium]